MERYADQRITTDLEKKAAFLTGPRQVGKTTLSHLLMERYPSSQYLNYDITKDRAVIEQQSWHPKAQLLVLDELHKMPNWKIWLKGVIDGRPTHQRLLVTGSARMDTFRQSGPSLAGRYFSLRLHPLSVREWCELAPSDRWRDGQETKAEQALEHLLVRGGFPEPCLAASVEDAERWRNQYVEGLVREDVVEFSRVQEIRSLRLFLEVLRERVGSPLSLASIARDLAVSAPTLKRYLDILNALFIVFTVHPWHRNVARSLLQQPKVYFYDTGLVEGDEGVRFENLVACHLLKHAQWQHDAFGRPCELHYLRTKDGAEVDFVLSGKTGLTHLIECKWADTAVHKALARFAQEFPQAKSAQLVRHVRQPEQRGSIEIAQAGDWLASLSA